LQQVPDLNNLCEMSGIHLRTLQRRLKSIDCNFSSMVDRVRHQKAETLLFDPDIKVTDIAYELGYNDSAHFSRAFKRWTGISPKHFRHQAICTEH
jgi:AraC-like DNA-binding protein